MVQLRNLHLIGTSHIAKESIELVKHSFLTIKPEVVCVELDKDRYHSLMNPNKRKPKNTEVIRNVGFGGFLFYKIGEYVQRKLAEKTGVKPGSDMLTAINLAHINNVKLALIDQHISITLTRFSKTFTFKYKMKVLWDLISAPFSKKIKVQLNLNKVPDHDTINLLLGLAKKRYPALYKVLVEERNVVMAKRLAKIMIENKDSQIMAVVGAGHEQEMVLLIEKELQQQNI